MYVWTLTSLVELTWENTKAEEEKTLVPIKELYILQLALYNAY